MQSAQHSAYSDEIAQDLHLFPYSPLLYLAQGHPDPQIFNCQTIVSPLDADGNNKRKDFRPSFSFGGLYRTRTCDTLVVTQVLYQLS